MDKICNNYQNSPRWGKEEFRRTAQACLQSRCAWRTFFSRKVQFAPRWHRVLLLTTGLSFLVLATSLVSGGTPAAIFTSLFFAAVGGWSILTGLRGRGMTVFEFLRHRGISPSSAAAEFEKSLEECGNLTDASGSAERLVRFVFSSPSSHS